MLKSKDNRSTDNLVRFAIIQVIIVEILFFSALAKYIYIPNSLVYGEISFQRSIKYSTSQNQDNFAKFASIDVLTSESYVV